MVGRREISCDAGYGQLSIDVLGATGYLPLSHGVDVSTPEKFGGLPSKHILPKNKVIESCDLIDVDRK